MAAPGIRAEVWADKDVQLPVTKGPNKIRPINDLWDKGWDEGEKPAAEEFNYVLNMLSRWINYIVEEQIPGLDTVFLTKANNLSDIQDRAIARLNLDVFSKAESDTRFVNVTGDTMSGPLTVPRIDFPNGGSDIAYITTTVAAQNWTHLDLVIGDDPGAQGTAGTDSIRLRFTPSGSATFNMMEINAINNTTAQATVNGNIVATGNVQANTVTAPSGTFTNLTVHNTINVTTVQAGTVNGTNINAADRLQGTTIIANSSITSPYARVNGETNTNSLVVNNNWGVVGGRHVVRAVNGYGADANGNLSLPMTPAGVQQIRFGPLQSFQERRGNERVAGGVMTTFADFGNSNYWVYVRTIQYLINGAWQTAWYT